MREPLVALRSTPTVENLRSHPLIPGSERRSPHPRDAVVREATTGGEHAEYWRGVYYGSMAALAKGRADQALEAIHAVVARPDVTP